MSWTLAALAERLGARVVGDGARVIHGLGTLEDAGPTELSFVTSQNYLEAARRSKAGALLVGDRMPELTFDRLVVDDPQLALVSLLGLFYPPSAPQPGVHPTAVVDVSATIEPEVQIEPYAVIGRGVRIAAGAVVGAHTVVGDGCVVGERSVLHPHVVLYPGVTIGRDSIVHSGTVLGADGFGYTPEAGRHRKIPQVGGVAIGDEVEIGALSAIDRGMLGATRIGDGTKIDNLVQVGHNVQIGRAAILCGQVGIAGSSRLGDGVVLGGRAGVGGHLELGAGTRVASASVVYKSTERGAVLAGTPALPINRWRRSQALAGRLEEFWRRLRAIERRVGAQGRDGVGGGGEDEV